MRDFQQQQQKVHYPTMMLYIDKTMVNSSIILALLSAYVVARASISTNTKTIINFLVLLPRLNAYMIAKTNILAKI